MPEKLQITRDVTKAECPWLDIDLAAGAIVYSYAGATYGCVGPDGLAVTIEPDTTPFFQVPRDATKPADATT